MDASSTGAEVWRARRKKAATAGRQLSVAIHWLIWALLVLNTTTSPLGADGLLLSMVSLSGLPAAWATLPLSWALMLAASKASVGEGLWSGLFWDMPGPLGIVGWLLAESVLRGGASMALILAGAMSLGWSIWRQKAHAELDEERSGSFWRTAWPWIHAGVKVALFAPMIWVAWGQ